MNRISSDIISLRSQKSEAKPDLAKRYKGFSKYKEVAVMCETSWRTKAFFLSMALSTPMITLMSICLDYRYRAGSDCCLILAIGVPIVVLTTIALITQNEQYKALQKFIDQQGQ